METGIGITEQEFQFFLLKNLVVKVHSGLFRLLSVEELVCFFHNSLVNSSICGDVLKWVKYFFAKSSGTEMQIYLKCLIVMSRMSVHLQTERHILAAAVVVLKSPLLLSQVDAPFDPYFISGVSPRLSNTLILACSWALSFHLRKAVTSKV